MSKLIFWIPKQVLFAHYVLFVHLTHRRSKLPEIERRIDQMHGRLFGSV